jgi:hypothetical protein
MKRAVSISIGSSRRDKVAEIELLGERVRLERMGTDGDMEKAAQWFRELDGEVDAFGVGGTDLALRVGRKLYALHSVAPLVRSVKHTPVVDGGGLKNTVEARLADFIDDQLGGQIEPRRALITSAADRWGMACSFAQSGYECIFGDVLFALGLPIRIRSLRGVRILAAIVLPIASRVPFEWLYPTGERQELRDPKWEREYQWAKVIAGDCHFIKRHMPPQLPEKVVVTNTTTPADVELFRVAGVSSLVTSTPVLDGRSFGTNMMEAALVAAAGKGRPLSDAELASMIDSLGLGPQLQWLNP